MTKMAETSLRAVDVTVGVEKRTGLFRRKTVDLLVEAGLTVRPGEVVGLVGESGSGKTTLARTLVGLRTPRAGSVQLGDTDVYALGAAARRRLIASQIGVVFQDPRSSLNRRLTIAELIEDPLVVQHWDASRRAKRVDELLDAVGLPRSTGTRKPFQISGGQLQRVALARALALGPNFLIADEPTSALDVSVQAQILNMIVDLRAQYPVGMLIITHDIRVLRFLSDRIVVLYLGRVVESGPTEQVVSRPRHPYTAALLSAVPRVEGAPVERRRLKGSAPHPSARPSGCPFRDRCWKATDACSGPMPEVRQGEQVAYCVHPEP
ncbi:MAG: ABC transporter ATP-binding protein [Hyphomicrobiales bacterium]|nr:MAG: ABC transporter ATP-binding protein [Hyphomicrobiales bacterium]